MDDDSCNYILSISITLTQWRCFNEDDGRGPKPATIFLFCFVAHRPGLDPGSSACQVKPTPVKPRQSATPARSILRAVYVFGWLRHQKLNEHAPTDRPACWIWLDMGGLGLITHVKRDSWYTYEHLWRSMFPINKVTFSICHCSYTMYVCQHNPIFLSFLD